jgi:hypothetical protein
MALSIDAVDISGMIQEEKTRSRNLGREALLWKLQHLLIRKRVFHVH